LDAAHRPEPIRFQIATVLFVSILVLLEAAHRRQSNVGSRR